MTIPDLEAGQEGLTEVKVRKAIQEVPSCAQEAVPGHSPGQDLDQFYLPLLTLLVKGQSLESQCQEPS